MRTALPFDAIEPPSAPAPRRPHSIAKPGPFKHISPTRRIDERSHAMAALSSLSLSLLAVLAGPLAGDSDTSRQDARNKQRCASFGFTQGTDGFANCVMQLTLKQEAQHPDHATLVRRYRDLSMARRGDDRYPVCGAAGMDNELDISTGKWVGPNCQMAPD